VIILSFGIADANHIAKNIVGIDSRILFEAEKTLLEQLTETSAKSIALVIGEQLTSQHFIGSLQ
jgi:protease-4